jgi:hypothetical protein
MPQAGVARVARSRGASARRYARPSDADPDFEGVLLMNAVLFSGRGKPVRRFSHGCERWRRFAAGGLLALLAVLQMAPARADVSPEARAALIDLYNNTSGPGWFNNAHWLEQANECSWYGVKCDPGKTKVIEIDLSANHLVGNFIPSPTATEGFDALETFDLSYNPGLTSAPIPDFSQLPALKKILLSGDKLSGTFPDLGGLANLEIVLLDDNQLTGFVPPIGALSKLASFVVASNRLTGPVPEISGLSNLITLDLRKNFFSGPLPKLPLGLKNVYVSNNQLSGTLPTLASVIGLDVFDAENNRLVGAIPVLPQLSQFRVAGNELSGSIPTPPVTLSGGFSSLCPNQLLTHGDAFWDAATGHSPWYGNTNCNTDPYGKENVQNDLIKVRPGQATRLLSNGLDAVIANDSLANVPSILQVVTSPPVSPPEHGAIILNNPDGSFIYRNTDGWSDSFLYWVCDGVDCETARVDIWVDNNTAPVAADDSLVVQKGHSADTLIGGATSVLANDREPDAGDSLTASLVKLPTAGNVRVNADGTFDYLNTNQAATVDYFEYSACDKSSECSIAKVLIQIVAGSGLPADQAPLAVADAIQVQPNGQASSLIGGAVSVLHNDTDYDGQTLAAIKLTDPANGTVTLNQDGTFTYTNTYSSPPVTTDSFTYEACDPYIVCTPATVTITITNAPQDHLPDPQADIVEVLPGQSANATVDGGTLLANDLDADLPNDALRVTKLTSPQHGDAIVQLDGSFKYTNTDPAATTDSFLVEVCDSFKACAASEVDVFVMHAPTVSKTFSPNNNVLVGATSQMTIKLTNPNARAITGVSFADNYPAFLVNASDTPFSNTCGGNADLQASAGWLNLTGATIPANGTCSIVVGAIPTKTAAIQNMTGPVTSGNAEAGASATGALHSTNTANHQSAPNVTQVFSPSTIAVGGASTLTISLTNPAGNALAVTDVTFTDLYPPSSYMVNGASATTDCGGTLTAIPGDIKVSLSGGVIPVGKSCSVVVEIAGMSAGSDWSHTGPVTSNNSDTAADVPALLTVTDSGLLAAPILEKKFVPDTVAPNATSTLTLTLTNPDPNNAIHGIKLDDVYPAGIRNGGGLPVMHDDCGFTTEDVPADLGWAKLDGGTLAGGQTCSVEITVVGTKTSTNQTGPVTSSNALAGAPDSATLTVNGSPPPIAAPTVQPISFNPKSIDVGDGSAMTITLHNNDLANEITGVQLSVIYPSASMVNGTGSPVESDDCQFTEDVPALDKTVVLSGGKIAAGQDCSIVIDVIGTASGFWAVQTSPVASDNAAIGPGGAGALQVIDSQPLQAPIVEHTFTPANVLVGGTAKLSIKLTNPPANNLAITGVKFADAYSLPAHIANKSGASTDCGGTLQALPGDTSIALAGSGGVIPQNGSCTIEVDVIGTSSGSSVSDVGQITSTNATTATAPTATVTVGAGALLNPPIVSKQFNPSMLAAPGMTSSMTIAFTNPNGEAIDGVQVNDQYPPGLLNDGPGNPVVSDGCGFTEDVPAGGAFAKLSGGSVPPGGCSIVITVVGNETATNDTGTVFSSNAMNAVGSTAKLTVNGGGGGGGSAQTIQFTSVVPNGAHVGGPTYHAMATASSGLDVALSIDPGSDTVCAIANDIVSFIGPGTCTIDANQGGGMNGGINYAPAVQVQQSFVVATSGGMALQTIAFTSSPPNNASVGGPAYFAAAVATPSNLPVVLTIDAASKTVCSINNGAVSFIGPGTCTVDADQGGGISGGVNYAPASQVQQSFDVATSGGVTPQTIAFTSAAPVNATVGGIAYFVTATATSGLPVVLTVDAASATVCTIGNDFVSFIGPGTCTIDANQGGGISGGVNYKAAPQVQQSFAVADSGGTTPQTIAFTSQPPVNPKVGDPAYLAMATATSGLPVVLTIDDASTTVCKIGNGFVSFIGAGTCTIDANQGGGISGGMNYKPAPQVQQSFVVEDSGGMTPQTITFTSSPPVNAMVGDPAYLVSATATSALPVVLTIDDASIAVCTISNDFVSFIGSGTCTIDANQGGGPNGGVNYQPAPQVQQSFEVTSSGDAPTVTCVLPKQIGVVDETYSLDLSLLFAPPPGQPSLVFTGTSLPPQLSIIGSLLTGTFGTSGTFTSTLTATVSAPGGASASENVVFQVLPADDILLRDGFDPVGSGDLPCQ